MKTNLKDKRLRSYYGKLEQKRYFLKAISCNQFLPLSTRKSALDGLKKLRLHGTKIHNYCRLTGRGRGVYRAYGLARSKFNILAGCGMLPGIRKSSW